MAIYLTLGLMSVWFGVIAYGLINGKEEFAWTGLCLAILTSVAGTISQIHIE